ncbi:MULTISPECIES: sce7726 family protein [unclassified Enterococcus]|uniref:sce7726 family protein n=1 Tax=unclassified Enterococcus TaxID=2608891 RepID=UPI001CE1A648|nr:MULTISPECIES: sce7726 family protein [unclassified Enterococcus]MCA5013733.1 sce7726 family protein [Enterococcus sp. S23]MCA5016983.1 sce7726 family protein [Enterococcus sp. S22(2020)]
MPNQQIDFERAQTLYKDYFTHSTNKTISMNILDTFRNELDVSFFKDQRISPREFLNLFLQKNYPNEISIKSNFINKVITKTKKHVTIFELNVGSSRVDLCKINGHSTAYEIKTELDSPKRLETQMQDYFKIFENVYLICPEKKLSLYEELIPEDCGIYTYRLSKTGKYFFKLSRVAKKSNLIDSALQLSTLTKRDLKYYFSCPDYSDKEKMVFWVKDKFQPSMINTIFKNHLKEKYQDNWQFLLNNKSSILEIDYQWFFKNQIPPQIVYI